MAKRPCECKKLMNEIECLKRENEMLLYAEKYDNKSELEFAFKRGYEAAENDFKRQYMIPGNKSIVNHILNQRKSLCILQNKYEKLLGVVKELKSNK